MDACMHWNVRYERTSETVTRICVDCGAQGTMPRCQRITAVRGAQCSGFEPNGPGTCRYHKEAS